MCIFIGKSFSYDSFLVRVVFLKLARKILNEYDFVRFVM